MKPIPLPSVEYLRECFSYCPITGSLKWKVRPLQHFINSHRMKIWNTKNANHEAGWAHIFGYRVLEINGRQYRAHRLIFKLMTGADPINEVDHKNEQKDDNRWENLRDATHGQNRWNTGYRKDNKLRIKGVSVRFKDKKFIAQIQSHGKIKYIGAFHSAQEAYSAYKKAALKYHGEFANFGKAS